MRTESFEVVGMLVPDIYADAIARSGLPPHTDMSRSNSCYDLTRDLHQALSNRGIESRRELHKTSDSLWHYVIAHAAADAAPADSDVITDMNPWQFPDAKDHGPLHAERQTVQEILTQAGAPEWFVSLRGISTIARAHTEQLLPGADFPDLRLG